MNSENKRLIREAHLQQQLTEPPRPCLCNWSQRYRYAKERWELKLQGLEAEIARLNRRLKITGVISNEQGRQRKKHEFVKFLLQ